MVNTRAKGYRGETKYRKVLESRGYRVERAIQTMWHKDFFGEFDLFAVKIDDALLAQVKTNKPSQDVFRAIREFQCPPGIRKVLVYFEKGSPVEVFL